MNRLHIRAALFATVSAHVFMAGQVHAQADGETATADEIIVNARRVEERLQDVPISISVVNQEQLTKANVFSSDDLGRVVPGLNVKGADSTSTFAIRGFSQELRTSAAVGTYFADVVAPRGGGISLQGGDGAGPGSVFDLQNIQVLKGPQGTLFGRNTTGGAVLLVPKKPTNKFEGYVEGSYGNYNMMRIQAVVNAPLASWARARIGVDRQTRDGWEHNVSGFGPKDFANVDYTAVRGSLVLDVAPTVENYTIISFYHSENNGTLPQLVRANSATFFGGLAQAQINRLIASGDRFQVEQKLPNPTLRATQFQVINTTKWLATDNLTIKNIMSYSSYRQDNRLDFFATNLPFPGTSGQAYASTSFSYNPDGYHTNDQKNFTDELQFQGTAVDNKLTYQVGLYYEHSTPGGVIASQSPSAGSKCLYGVAFTSLDTMRCASGSVTFNTGTIEFINMAAYSQATYAITDKLKLTGGVRITYDRSKGFSSGRTATFQGGGAYVGATIVGCALGYSAADNCQWTGRTSSTRPTWTANLSYSPSEDLMLYGTYSRGYRQGAVAPFAVAGRPIFDPETVDNYELGTKTSFRGAISGNLNFAAFYTKLRNQQIQVGLQNTNGVGNPTGSTATSIFNAGKSRMYGVEFDGNVRLAPFFRINASATYVNTLLQSITVPTSFPGYNVVIASALAGDPLPFTPKFGSNITGTLTLPVPETIGAVEFAATYRHASPYTTAASTATTVRASEVNQLDLNLDWRNVGGRPIDLGFFGTNMTNQFTRVGYLALFSSFGFDELNIGKPRFYGVRLKVRFDAGN